MPYEKQEQHIEDQEDKPGSILVSTLLLEHKLSTVSNITIGTNSNVTEQADPASPGIWSDENIFGQNLDSAGKVPETRWGRGKTTWPTATKVRVMIQ